MLPVVLGEHGLLLIVVWTITGLAAALVLGYVSLRRLGTLDRHLADAVQRLGDQTAETRQELGERDSRLTGAGEEIRLHVANLSLELKAAISSFPEIARMTLAAQVNQFESLLQEISQREHVNVEDLGTALRKLEKNLAAIHESVTVQGLAFKQTTAAAAALHDQPPRAAALNTSILEGKTHDEMISIARSVAFVRPLVPYPKWRFDVDWANPDAAFQLRRCIWQSFHDARLEIPLTIPWHYRLELRLYLGNDISRLAFVGGAIDPNELAFLDRVLETGMTFLDCGANEGIYTIFAAKRVGPRGEVWAFEPSRRELDRLQANIKLNRLKAQVFPVALAESTGKEALTVAGYGHEGHNTLGAFAYEGTEAVGKESVGVTRIDEVVARRNPARIDVIKLDVEGAEYRVLQGATETLRRFKPTLLLELSEPSLRHQGASGKDLVAFLKSIEYDLYRFDDLSGLPVPAASDWSDNIVAVPRSAALPEKVYQFWPQP
jgi:FkbM family methyltransferase